MANVLRHIHLSFWLLCAAGIVAVTHAATAVPVQDIRAAQQQMEQGAAAEALETLQELLVDHPQSPEVRFSIGCAWFMLGDQQKDAGDVEAAQQAYSEARAVFDALLTHENAAIAREAAFNRANCLAREADMIEQTGDYGETVEALRRAAKAYETGLNEYPVHEQMRANHDHVRFRLKQLLQNPPPEEEQDEQDKQEQEQPDTPPLMSYFGFTETDIPGAQAVSEDNIAILEFQGRSEARP